ncbi:MAG: BON domain-containing protein [Pseudomonadota bacterium]
MDTREDGLRIVILGLIGFALIFPLCVWKHVQPIETDLLERSVAALSEHELTLDVSVSGRDVTLVGYVDNQGQQAYASDIVSQVRGVRIVKNETKLRTPSAGGTQQ